METAQDDMTIAILRREWDVLAENLPAGDLQLRVYRSIRWIEGAVEKDEQGDDDAAFIFYWIAFNAAYAVDKELSIKTNETERDRFVAYFTRIVNLDTKYVIHDAIRQRFRSSIARFMKNRYVYRSFWDFRRTGEPTDWEDWFEYDKQRVNEALDVPGTRPPRSLGGVTRENTSLVLSKLFDRLYVLRNQLMHGGATWKGRLNRKQVREGKEILGFLIPLFVHLMMTKGWLDDWGDPPYPPIAD